MPPRDPAFPPELAETFEPLRVLGRGGMGVVFAARDRTLDRTVAVKLIFEAADRGAVERFRREAETLGRAANPFVVEVYDFGVVPSGAYLVMELVEGPSLQAFQGDQTDALQALADVAGALATLHGKGVVHRDVKPANIVLEPGKGGKLVDFGLVHDPGRTRMTGTGQVLGTLAYMAPDLLRGGAVTPAADWYGWAASTYQLYRGAPPYETEDVVAWATGKARLPALRWEGVPAPLVPLLRGLLGVEPAARLPWVEKLPGAMEEMGVSWRGPKDLVVEPEPESRVGNRTVALGPEPPGGRGRGPRLLLGLAVLGLAGFLALGPVPPEEDGAPVPGPVSSHVPRDVVADRAAELDARIAEFVEAHGARCATYTCLQEESGTAHARERSELLRDPRVVLGVRRLGRTFLDWLEDRARAPGWGRELEAPEDRLRIRAMTEGLLPHLLHDYGSLTDRGDVVLHHRRDDLAVLAELGKTRVEVQDEVAALAESLERFLPDGPDILAGGVGTLSASAGRHPESLLELVTERVPSTGSVDSLIQLGTGWHNLMAGILRRDPATCAGAPGRVPRDYGRLLTGADPLGSRASAWARQRVLLMTKEALDGCSDAVVQETMDQVLWWITEAEPGTFAQPLSVAVLRDLRMRARRGRRAARLRPRPYDELWWLILRESRLSREPERVARALPMGLRDASISALERTLGVLEEGPREGRRTEVWSAALRLLLGAERGGKLEPGGDLVGRAVRVLATGDPGAEGFAGIRELARGFVDRLDLSSSKPDPVRMVLRAVVMQRFGHPLLTRLAVDIMGVEDEVLSEEARDFLWAARNAAIETVTHEDPRLRDLLADRPCEMWSAATRAAGGVVGAPSLTTLVDGVTWRLPWRVHSSGRCLQVCPAAECTDNPASLDGWLDDLEGSAAPTVREEQARYCREFAATLRDTRPDTSPANLNRLERRAALCDP